MLENPKQELPVLRFVALSQGDQGFSYWSLDPSYKDFVKQEQINVEEAKSSWVTDVSWDHSIGVNVDTLAVSTQNNLVIIYKQDSQGKWLKQKQVIETGAPAWKLNWSQTGGLLAVNCGEDQVKVYKEDVSGTWKEL